MKSRCFRLMQDVQGEQTCLSFFINFMRSFSAHCCVELVVNRCVSLCLVQLFTGSCAKFTSSFWSHFMKLLLEQFWNLGTDSVLCFSFWIKVILLFCLSAGAKSHSLTCRWEKTSPLFATTDCACHRSRFMIDQDDSHVPVTWHRFYLKNKSRT